MLGNGPLVKPDSVIEFVESDEGPLACMDGFHKTLGRLGIDGSQTLFLERSVHKAADHRVRLDAGLT